MIMQLGYKATIVATTAAALIANSAQNPPLHQPLPSPFSISLHFDKQVPIPIALFKEDSSSEFKNVACHSKRYKCVVLIHRD